MGSSNRHRRKSMARRAIGLAIAALLTLPAIVAGASSIFDDDWKPPSDSAKPSKPAEPAKPPPDEPVASAPRLAPRPKPPEPAKLPGSATPPAPALTPAKPAARLAMPTGVAVASAEKIVKEVFKADYARKQPAEQIAFSRTLLSEAQQTKDDPATLYVLLRDARDLASAGGEAEVALEAARGLRDNFQIDVHAARQTEIATLEAAVRALVANPPALVTYEAAHRSSDLTLELAEQALSDGDYAGAAQLAATADSAARRTRDWEYPARVHGRVAWMQAIDAAYQTDQASIASLKSNPADPAANLAAGRFDFAYLDRPDLAMPLLAKGADDTLKALALKDLASTGSAATPAAICAAADAWVEAARTSSVAALKDAMQRRALILYDRCIPSLNGLEQIAAHKREDDLRMTRVLHGLNGEYFRGEKLMVHAVTRIDPRLEFSWDSVVPDIAVPREHFTARWTGWIKAAPGTYKLTAIHDDGIRIWMDGRLVLDNWGNWGKESFNFAFTGRLQELKVEYRQGDGGASFGLGWIAPGTTKAKAIPNEACFRDPQPPGWVTEPFAVPGSDGQIQLSAGAAMLHGPDLQFLDDPTRIQHWIQVNDWASWDFDASEGDYSVMVS